MISNSGQTRAYDIETEPDLVRDIIEAGERGELEIYEIEELTTSGQTHSSFEADVKREYYDQYGEDFEDWRW